MARPTTKEALVELSKTNFEKLWKMIETMPEEVLNTPFDFTNDLNKKEAHWRRDKNLRDILVHLFEWHQLLLNWIYSNCNGKQLAFLPSAYTWKTYGEMNIKFWEKHQTTPLEEAKEKLMSSHSKVLVVIEKFSNEELFTKQHFNWTGSTSLGSYCVSAMPSHYEWAIKKLRAHSRKLSSK